MSYQNGRWTNSARFFYTLRAWVKRQLRYDLDADTRERFQAWLAEYEKREYRNEGL